MDTFIDILMVILIVTALVLFFYLAMSFKTKKEIEQEEKLKKSLEDEFIIDPETGAKLTLEQAESGHWIAHDSEYRTTPESEIEKYSNDDRKTVLRAINYLKGSKTYRKTQLTERQFDILENTQLLSHYDDWHYSHPFRFDNGIVILPAPEIHSSNYYSESHIMFWVNVNNINGHYVFREKSNSEKFFDLLRNDDDIKLDNYECFTFKKSHSIILIKSILKHFQHQQGLLIEIHNDNLFIKTTKLVNLDDIIRIENSIKKLP